jgi:hypothetical protein
MLTWQVKLLQQILHLLQVLLSKSTVFNLPLQIWVTCWLIIKSFSLLINVDALRVTVAVG